jgi:DNA-binding ferritin-like protein (Dps family)
MAVEEELNYTKKILKTKEKNLQEESHLVDLKVQAIDAEYKQSYGEMKKILSKNNKSVKLEVSKLFYVLSMIEQNTMHGRHLTLSETNVGLLLKLRSGLEDINSACADPDKPPSTSSSDGPVSEVSAGRDLAT